MAQYEYQLIEQAGGRVTLINERLDTLSADGWEPLFMTGSPPHVSILLRRLAQPKAAQPAAAERPAAQAQAGQRPPAARPPGPTPPTG